MRIDFDPAKDAANIAKHGLSLVMAVEIDFTTVVIRSDDRHDYGESRWRAYGMIGDRMHMLAFTVRDGTMRAISLRKANAKERRRHGPADVQP